MVVVVKPIQLIADASGGPPPDELDGDVHRLSGSLYGSRCRGARYEVENCEC